MVSVNIAAPSCRAVRTGTGSEKKIQTGPPLPDRDRSRAAGPPFARHLSAMATCEQAPKQRTLVGAGGRRRDGRCISDGYRLMIDLRQRRSLAQKIGERCL